MLDCENLQKDLDRALAFFESDVVARELPFAHSFPRNCCERSAALLSVALARKYKSERVLYVKGRDPGTGEMHFWVEIGTTVLDVTAHQFDSFERPLLCQRPNPMEQLFGREEECKNPEVETDLIVNSNGRWHEALARLSAVIEA